MLKPPILVVLIQKLSTRLCPFVTSRISRDAWYRVLVLVVTYMVYTGYHLSRKPLSVVKPVLNRNCSTVSDVSERGVIFHFNSSNWCDWAPFDQSNGKALLGLVDSCFLVAYAIAMFFSGYVAERVNLRYFLTLGLFLSGLFTALFGLARPLGLHTLSYFAVVQVFGGIASSSGWPAVVTAVANWFGKGKRGLVFGIWNSHTSVGNILGTIVASAFVESNWGLSFIVPGLILFVMGILVFMLLVPHPTDVGCHPPQQRDQIQKVDLKPEGEAQAVGILTALFIPGVMEFSLCLFFAKLVSYTFLYWLPTYISASTTYGASESGDLSTLFDVGGIVGGILAGAISDISDCNALICTFMMVAAIPALLLYWWLGAVSLGLNITLLIVAGILVNGPYALITTAVSAELGTHPKLQNSARALATVTAVIDGTGSIGAALGPSLAGWIASFGWGNVFYMMITSEVCACLVLSRLTIQEARRLLKIVRDRRRLSREMTHL